jgi:hemerythrin-like domain-containing protein
MKGLEWLAREHEAIHTIVARLEVELGELGQSGELDVEAFERLLAFFEQRVDGHHQENEERVFLPLLAVRAEDGDMNLVRAASAEHRLERERLERLRAQLEGAAYGEAGALGVILHEARRYARRHRQHARWEAEVLFPIALRTFTPEDDTTLVAGFRALEHELGGSVIGAAAALGRWLDARHRLLA